MFNKINTSLHSDPVTDEMIKTADELLNKNKLTKDKANELVKEYSEANSEAKNLVKETAADAKVLGECSSITDAWGKKTKVVTNTLTTAKNLAGKFVSTLVNGLASAALAYGVTSIVNGISYGIGEITGKNEAKRNAEQVRKTIELTSAYKEEADNIQSLKASYEELNDKLEKNKDDIDLILDVKSQLRDIQDTLVEKYGHEVEGIDLVNGKYEEQLALINDLNKSKAINYLYGAQGVANKDGKGKTKIDRISKVLNEKYDGDTFYLRSGNENIELIEDAIEYLRKKSGDIETPEIAKYQKIIDNIKDGTTLGSDIDEVLDKYEHIYLNNTDFGVELKIKPVDKKVLNDELASLRSEIAARLDDPRFRDLNEKLSEIKIGFNEEKYEEAFKSAKDFARLFESSVSEGGKTLEQKTKEAIETYQKAYNEYISNPNKDTEQGFNKAQEEIIKAKAEIQAFKEKYSSNNEFTEMLKGWEQIYEDLWNTLPKTGKQKLNEYFGNRLSDFIQLAGDVSEAEANIIYNMLSDINIEDLTKDELIAIIQKAQEYLDTNPLNAKLKASTSVDLMADLKTATGSLKDLYSQTVDKEAKDGQATGFADPALLNNIESGFKKFVKEAKDAGKEVGDLSIALEDFEQKMIESPDDAKKNIDELTTAYIDQTGILEDLTEERKEWAKEQLKAMGIENAETVVETRLNNTYKQSRKNLIALADAVSAHRKELTGYAKDSKEFKEAAGSIKESVSNMLGSYNIETGEMIAPAQIDDEFIANNLEDILLLIEGDNEALDRLYAKLALINGTEVLINANLNTEEYEYDVQKLTELIDYASSKNIETWAYLDDSYFMNGLSELVNSSQAAANAANAAFSQIGMSINYRNTGTSSFRIPKPGSGILGGIASAAAMVADTITFDNFEIVATSKRGSVGSGANYVPSSGGSSGSGGGGGGGGGSDSTKPKEEAEETFDWIEVAIKRIEEEINRLDKIVGNSYTLWGNRNKALASEISEVTEEIKAQQIAQSEYMRNASLVKVNNGKGLSDDDYGENDEVVREHDQKLLDEARAAWATGEYQRKVREGLMTGDDIERIQNHFLSDTIKNYQELYEKSVQAGDAVQDLRIRLGDLAQTRFENIKSEYEELIAFITDSADLIDAKISRTEEHGYFVSKTYYKDLLKLESKNLNYLEGEYVDLIEKRDEAVAEGSIQKNSSAWNQMCQEIDSVAKAIEDSKTKTVELNNAIRQLDWDMFDWIEDRIEKINEEASFFVDLMSNEKLFDDTGIFNERGEATAGMYAIQYETYMRKAMDYAKERKKLEKEIAADPANKTLVERYEELVSAQQDAIKSSEQLKDSMKSLVSDAINKHLESLQKLIDQYKKSLHDARDLYSYQQNIEKQVKDIGDIEKQLAAYEGDNSEEANATIQKLRQNLEDAQKQLEETQWDKYISETETFLDDMYNDYSETLNARLDDIDALMTDMIDHVDNNANLIATTISDEAKQVGYDLTDNFENILNGNQQMLTMDLQNSATTVVTAITNVQAVIEDIKKYVHAMGVKSKAIVDAESKKPTAAKSSSSKVAAGANTSAIKKATAPSTKTTSSTKASTANKATNTSTSKRSDKDYYGVALAIINGGYGWGDGDNRWNRLKAKGFDADKVQNLVNKLWAEGYIHSGAWIGRYQGIKDLSPFAYNKYAKGSKGITHDQIAWTQEEGAELIFRKDDGSLLMPLGTGDKVFTAQMTDNLWDIAKGKFATTGIPTKNIGNTINNANSISISLPNVNNYEEFKTQLKKDPKLTAFIQQITLGEAVNGVKLSKKKY